MPEDPVIQLRRALLRAAVAASRLTDIAEKCEKPARQIKDMIEGRKAFGDRIARELEPKLRPNAPHGWLLFPTAASFAADQSEAALAPAQQQEESPAVRLEKFARRAEDTRPQIGEITAILRSMTDDELADVMRYALLVVRGRAASAESPLKQTAA